MARLSNNNLAAARCRGLATAIAVIMLLCGCSDGNGLAPVRGVVEYDGKPLTGFDHAAVVFTPASGRFATSIVGPDGTFQLTTSGIGEGVVPGRAGVAVSATVNAMGKESQDREARVRWVIPEKFGNADSSSLSYDVLPGKENVLRIVLKSDGVGSISNE